MASSVATRHVLIVGGGLAGPCLALSLARHHIRSTIFELRPTYSGGGGSISLGPNALRVLDRYAGVYDLICATGFSYHRFDAYTNEGEKLGCIAVGEEKENGYPAVRIMRSSLHKLLLEAAEQTNGMVDIKYGVKLSKIEEDAQGVTAFFEDGTTAKGDILIGADGVHSQVRKHILGSESPTPKFDDMCIVYGFVPASNINTSSTGIKFPAMMFTPSGVFMTLPIDPESKTLAWVITKSMSCDRSREQWREFERSGEAARVAKADYDDIKTEPIRSLIDNADDAHARLWPAYSIPDIPTWHTGRVCLIGDAAHCLPPNGAQGAAMAFEDAAILTRLLASNSTKSYEELFTRFEAIRRPRIAELKRGSQKGGVMKAKTCPVGWYLKKWAFRGFFRWNGGVLQHNEETAYNVDEAKLDV